MTVVHPAIEQHKALFRSLREFAEGRGDLPEVPGLDQTKLEGIPPDLLRREVGQWQMAFRQSLALLDRYTDDEDRDVAIRAVTNIREALIWRLDKVVARATA